LNLKEPIETRLKALLNVIAAHVPGAWGDCGDRGGAAKDGAPAARGRTAARVFGGQGRKVADDWITQLEMEMCRVNEPILSRHVGWRRSAATVEQPGFAHRCELLLAPPASTMRAAVCRAACLNPLAAALLLTLPLPIALCVGEGTRFELTRRAFYSNPSATPAPSSSTTSCHLTPTPTHRAAARHTTATPVTKPSPTPQPLVRASCSKRLKGRATLCSREHEGCT
jgi:hypothetical protein